MATHPQPLDVAGAIADLTPIDWDVLEADATNAIDRATLGRLRLLDRIVRACADVVQPTDSDVTHTAGGPGRPPESNSPPTTWGPFTIHERVGRGTFGDVYRAHDRRLDRIVALKLLRPGRQGGDVLESEAIHEGRLLAKVRHPNVVTVHGAERIDGRVGVWMEFIGGRTLEEELKANGPLPPNEVVTIGLTMCSALAAVHEAGLLHRDLKAQNVLRASDGRIILTDFGAGRVMAIDADEGRPEMAGTPLYLAPEILAGKPASVSSELYGLGVLLYHLATGSFPVRGRTLRELRQAHAKAERVSIRAYRDKLPNSLMAIIDRAVDPDPARRFSSVEEFRGALGRAGQRATRWPLLGAGAALLVLAGANVVRMQQPVLSIASTRIVSRPSATPALAIEFARGNRVYYSEGNSLYSTGLGIGDAPERVVGEWNGFKVVDIDSSGSQFLAFGATEPNGDRQLWIALGTSGQLRRVGDAKCGTAVWSPDNAHIACVNASERLSIVSTDGSTIVPLTGPPADSLSGPQWSPDGKRLRFNATTKDRDVFTTAIWEIGADNTGLHQILPGWNTPPGICWGAWTPDGEYYIFRAESRETGLNELWALREHRTLFDWALPGPIRLAAGPLSYDSVFINGDGTQLLATAGEPRSELVRLDATSHKFTPYLGGVSGTWISFSPDQKAFTYIGFPLKRLWRQDASGSRRLIDVPAEVDGVAWSPDGKWLSFVSRLAGKHRRIFLSSPDGSNPQPISPVDDEQGIATWSADSRYIAYGDVPVLFGIATGKEVLHIYDLETRRVTDVPGSKGLWTCRWSPDGRYLAALTIDERMMLMLRDMKTGTWRSIPAANHINNLTWAHDSQSIFYDTEGGPREIRRVRISDEHVDNLSTQQDFYFSTMWSGLAPDDSPLVAHNNGTVDIYAMTLRKR